MTIVLQPQTTVSIVGANATVQNADQKVLFVGQQGSGSSITSGSLVENIQANTEASLFDANSMLANMIRSARNQNPITQFDAIPLDDNGAGTPADGVIDFTGSTATANGTLTIAIGSKKDYSLSLGISDTDDATTIGSNLESLINTTTGIPVTAVNTAGSVAITAVNAGTLGNAIGIEILGSVAGVTVALTPMANGATDPVLTNIFDVIIDKRYQAIVWPYWADTTELVDELEERFNVTNKILDGVGFTSSMDTFANSLTRLNALNSQVLVSFEGKTTVETAYSGPDILELLPSKSAEFAAIRALRLTDNASISDVVIANNGTLDNFGGPALASKPYFNTPMKDLEPIGTGRGYTESEIEQLHNAGGSVIGNNSSSTDVLVGEVVTTYKTDPVGNPDISYKYLNYVDTATNCREYFFNNLRARYAQTRLTEGNVIKGRDQTNAILIKAFCEKLYQDLSGPDFVLLEAGEEATTFYKNNIVVTIDKAQGLATITMVVPLVTQLREILATMQIAFSTNQ